MKMLLDAYSGGTTGQATMTFFVWADVVLEHLSAFAVGTSFS